MFPWNYGFHWSVATIIFLGAFYTVLVIVATTVLSAAWRGRRALRREPLDAIRWHSDFHELAPADRVCRHVLTGEFRRRECPNAFDCRKCETHAKWLAQHPALPAADPESEIYGMSFPLDRFYHRGHTWARLETDGSVTVGLDELGKRLIGTPDTLDLPEPGTRVTANGIGFRARRRNADIRILSPVEGKVLETGGPEHGWFLRIWPDNLDLTHLLRGAEVRAWVLREIERLQLALSREGAPTLADGGVPVADIAASCPEADWDAVCSEMFLRP
jgi:glycine cleavage system H lipoate-binding protein